MRATFHLYCIKNSVIFKKNTNIIKAGCILSIQVVINKCFLLNPEKKLAKILPGVFEKNAKNAPLIPKNDVTEQKSRLL